MCYLKILEISPLYDIIGISDLLCNMNIWE